MKDVLYARSFRCFISFEVILSATPRGRADYPHETDEALFGEVNPLVT